MSGAGQHQWLKVAAYRGPRIGLAGFEARLAGHSVVRIVCESLINFPELLIIVTCSSAAWFIWIMQKYVQILVFIRSISLQTLIWCISIDIAEHIQTLRQIINEI